MANENKFKHIDIIQCVINRLASNSFMIKGWAITLVAALFVLSQKDTNYKFMWIALLPAIMFAILDSFYLWKERLYRELYKTVIKKEDREIDFSMDVTEFNNGENTWVRSFFSYTILLFYIPFIIVLIVLIAILT